MPMIKSRGDGTGFIGKGTKPSGWIPEGLATKRANKTHVDEVERGQTTSSPEKEREKTNMKVALFAVTGAMVLGVTGLRAGPGHFGDGAGLPPQLAEFDKNGDGKLDETERAALKAAMEAKRQAFIKKYDANGDGILSSDELAKAHSDQEAQRRGRMEQCLHRTSDTSRLSDRRYHQHLQWCPCRRHKRYRHTTH